MNLSFLITVAMFLSGYIGFLSFAFYLLYSGYIGIVPLLFLVIFFYTGHIPRLMQALRNGGRLIGYP